MTETTIPFDDKASKLIAAVSELSADYQVATPEKEAAAFKAHQAAINDLHAYIAALTESRNTLNALLENQVARTRTVASERDSALASLNDVMGWIAHHKPSFANPSCAQWSETFRKANANLLAPILKTAGDKT